MAKKTLSLIFFIIILRPAVCQVNIGIAPTQRLSTFASIDNTSWKVQRARPRSVLKFHIGYEISSERYYRPFHFTGGYIPAYLYITTVGDQSEFYTHVHADRIPMEKVHKANEPTAATGYLASPDFHYIKTNYKTAGISVSYTMALTQRPKIFSVKK